MLKNVLIFSLIVIFCIEFNYLGIALSVGIIIYSIYKLKQEKNYIEYVRKINR